MIITIIATYNKKEYKKWDKIKKISSKYVGLIKLNQIRYIIFKDQSMGNWKNSLYVLIRT